MKMEILIKPVITEKMSGLAEDHNRYGFVVAKGANKIEIKNAVEKMYGVTVESVNTMNHGGKRKSRYTRTGLVQGKTNAYKKAIVTLADGDIIDFYSNI